MLSFNKKEWILPTPLPEAGLAGFQKYPRLIQQILLNRGYTDVENVDAFLHTEGELLDPYLLSGVPQAVDRLQLAIEKNEKMVVYGDFDVDGVTGCSLLTLALDELGAQVSAYIPDRFSEGYGLNEEAIRAIAQDGAQVLVTVDCGIRSIKEVALAQELGMDVILTDHHLPGDQIPPARAVICQKKDDEQYPNRHIAGVGLAYKLMMALFQQFNKDSAAVEKYLDLVALGTVADVVALVGENRVFVQKGLRVIHTTTRPGLRALIAASGIVKPELVTAEDIGFRLGPRINAAGRLNSALLAWNLLTTQDGDEAMQLAEQLNALNVERQEKTEVAFQIAAFEMLTNPDDGILFAINEDFHEGIVGLVASRLSEQYYRPAIVGTAHNGCIRASCRSVAAFNITRALDECADLLVQYGGHAMAAGLTVERKDVEPLIDQLTSIAQQQVDWENENAVLRVDAEVNSETDGRQLAEIMQCLDLFEPNGEGNRKPLLFSRGLAVVEKRPVGREKSHLKLKLRDGRAVWDAIAFRMGELTDNLPERVDVAFHYAFNDYNGGIQMIVQDLRAARI